MKKIKITATVDKDIADKLFKLAELSGISFSKAVNYLLRKEEERLDRLILKYSKVGGLDKT